MVRTVDKISFQLVSPEQILYADQVTMAVIPSSAGEMGVMKDHTPLGVTLAKGIINIYQGDTLTEKIFITGGFANINEQGCTVMADEGINVRDIAPDQIEQHIADVMQQMKEAVEEDERIALEKDLAVARSKMEIYKKLQSIRKK
ncbi:MAG: ATP synthase F1 subunit epsilon [Alphaproteobacteria bacterium]